MAHTHTFVAGFPQTHAVYAAHPQSPTSHSFIHASAPGQSVIFIRTGQCPPRLSCCSTSRLIISLLSLTTWLAHSKKKNCDVCKHPYSFTKGILSAHINPLTEAELALCGSICLQYAAITSSGVAGTPIVATCLPGYPLSCT